MAEAEKTFYVVNTTFITHEISGVVFPRGHFVALNDVKLKELKKNAIFANLVSNKQFEIKDEIDDSMRTTEEQLAQSKSELIAAKKEQEDLKNEALAEIAKRDKALSDKDAEIAALKAELEKANKGK